MSTNKPDALHVASGVSQRTGEAFLQITWGPLEGQWTPEEAREFAMHLLTTAEAAEQDALLVRFVEEVLQGSRAHAAGILDQYRKWRTPSEEEAL